MKKGSFKVYGPTGHTTRQPSVEPMLHYVECLNENKEEEQQQSIAVQRTEDANEVEPMITPLFND